MKRKNESSLDTGSNLKRSAITGTLLAVIIASTPILFSLHESVPSQRYWSTFLFEYDSGFWEDAQYAMWVFTTKLIPLLLLTIWFFTCRHWWYHAILVPMIMYIIQITLTYNAEVGEIDEFQVIYLLPVMAIIIPSIYLIRAKMFDKINNAHKTMEELEEEFMFKPTTIWGKVKQYF